MAKKILKTLTNNIGFKLLAVVISCVLWLVVYNLDDPNKTKQITTNVTIINSDVVTNMNKCYEVLGGSNTVTFSVTAKRSYLDNLDDTNFTATADMNNLVMSEDGKTATVRIEFSSNRYNRYISYGNAVKYLKLSLEDLKSQQFVVSADVSGTVAENYALGEVVVTNPTVVTVSGPESIVSKIDRVVATIDVDGMFQSISDNVVPKFYDASGNRIDMTRLKLSTQTVTIAAKILGTKEVGLNFSTVGIPAAGGEVASIVSDPSKIMIKGPASSLNPITMIDIPSEILNVEGISDKLSTTIDITEYLPEGVELLDESQRTVTIEVVIEKFINKSFTLQENNVKIVGVPAGMNAQLVSNNITIVASGMESEIEKILISDLMGSVDVTGLGAGVHRLSLEVEPTGAYTIAEKTVDVILTEEILPGTDTDTGSDTENDTATEESESVETETGEQGGSESSE